MANVISELTSRDAMCKFVYSKLFDWLVVKVKRSLATEDGSAETLSVNILDIFGFESFETNSFEQLCINYCNEMLQNHFNFVIFTAEKQLYAEENIFCDTIEFRDNQAVINDIQTAFVNLDEEAAKLVGRPADPAAHP